MADRILRGDSLGDIDTADRDFWSTATELETPAPDDDGVPTPAQV
jgi:hypothetical protein